MLRGILSFLWRHAPRKLRRWGVRAVEPHFTVTAGAVVTDNRGRVLLLKHNFRAGSGWGIPGGFIEKGEQPEAAIRRELREEVGLEVEDAKLVAARTLKVAQQVELLYRCRALDGDSREAKPQNMEIKRTGWFDAESLPPELSDDQRRLIKTALDDGAQNKR